MTIEDFRPGGVFVDFKERDHGTVYHDFRLYVSGVDISELVMGSVEIQTVGRDGTNTCTFQLDNAEDKLLFTANNLDESLFPDKRFKLSGDYQYSERFKHDVWDYKRLSALNIKDELTGDYRWPFYQNGPCFHKHDPVRLFIHNPISTLDEWMPLFTGFCDDISFDDDYVNGTRTMSISCYDIRGIMQRQRVQLNSTILHENPANKELVGEELEGLGTVDAGVFADLIIPGTYTHPFAQNTLVETFLILIIGSVFLADESQQEGSAGIQVTSELLRLRENLPILNALNKRVKGVGAFIPGLVFRYANSRDGLKAYEIMKNFSSVETPTDSLGRINTTGSSEGTQLWPLSGIKDMSDWYRLLLFGRILDLKDSLNTDERTNAQIRLKNDPKYAAMIEQQLFDNGYNNLTEQFNNTPLPEKRKRQASSPSTSNKYKKYEEWLAEEQANRVEEAEDAAEKKIKVTLDPSLQEDKDYEGFVPLTTDDLINVQATAEAERVKLSGDKVETGPVPLISGYSAIDQVDRSLDREWLPLALVDRIGTQSTFEGAYSPLRQRLHFLLPADGLELTKLIDHSIDTGADTRSWSTRADILNDITGVLDYQWWVTGIGDIIIEFPQYDFFPNNYGEFESVLVADRQVISSNIGDDNGEVVTCMQATGTFTDQNVDPAYDEGAQPRIAIFNVTMASRVGVNVRTISVPFTRDTDRLVVMAYIALQKELAMANKASCNISYRPFLLPNKPFYLAGRTRVTLINDVNHSIQVHDLANTTMTLQYVRNVRADGSVRLITGAQGMPVSYNIIADQTVQQFIDDNIAEIRLVLEEEKYRTEMNAWDNLASDKINVETTKQKVGGESREEASRRIRDNVEEEFKDYPVTPSSSYETAEYDSGETAFSDKRNDLDIYFSKKNSVGPAGQFQESTTDTIGLPTTQANAPTRAGTGFYVYPNMASTLNEPSSPEGAAQSTVVTNTDSQNTGTSSSYGEASSNTCKTLSDVAKLSDSFKESVESWITNVTGELGVTVSIVITLHEGAGCGYTYHSEGEGADFTLARADGSKVETSDELFALAGDLATQQGLRWGGDIDSQLRDHIDSGSLGDTDTGHEVTSYITPGALGDFWDWVIEMRRQESNHNYGVVNTIGYLGAYQFGVEALSSYGFTTATGNKKYAWVSPWTMDKWLADLDNQDKTAFRYWANWAKYLRNKYGEYLGENFRGVIQKMGKESGKSGCNKYYGDFQVNIKWDLSGTLSAAHLVGGGRSVKNCLGLGLIFKGPDGNYPGVSATDAYGHSAIQRVLDFTGYDMTIFEEYVDGKKSLSQLMSERPAKMLDTRKYDYDVRGTGSNWV
jgi:hypothetical protein